MFKPIIGIVSKHRDLNESKRTYLSDNLKNAIFANNGVVVGIVPSMKKITLVNPDNENDIYDNLESLFTNEEKENLILQIKLCNGIILAGGKETDAYELWIAKYCYENDIPIIGICAGSNNIVRAIGGRTKKVNNPEFHYSDELYAHNVNVDKNSKFINFTNKENFMVNSRHKNTIMDPKYLSVAAYDNDENIEVTEAKNKKCYVGIRFHPELLYEVDEIHNNIFKEFIKICSKENAYE